MVKQSFKNRLTIVQQ